MIGAYITRINHLHFQEPATRLFRYKFKNIRNKYELDQDDALYEHLQTMHTEVNQQGIINNLLILISAL